MKIRITMLTENSRPRPDGLTEEKVVFAYQAIMSALCGMDDKCTVEAAEFVEENNGADGE